MLIITDIAGNTEALTGYKGLKRYRNVSGEKTLAFLLLPTNNNSHSFHMVQEESILDFDGDTYRIKQVSEKNRGQTFIKEVVAIHTFFDLIDEHVYNLHTGSMTFQAALQFVLDGTGYTWDIVDSFLARDFENFGDDNRLALFQDLMKSYQAEFTLSGTHFTFKQKIGNATDFQFRYSYNIKTINRNVNTNNLSTYIKGYGKQNEDGSYLIQSEYTSPNAAVFGIRHAKPVKDERYTTIDGLNERLKAEIKDSPELSITLDFVDLRRAGFPYDVPGEGDDVFLLYEPMNIDVEARIMEIEEEFTEFNEYPIKTNVTLANIRNNITDKWVEFSRTQKQVNGIIDGSVKIPYNALDEAVRRATVALQSAQTELEFENGIIARDKNNPNFLVLFNSNGIGISRDGGATFKEAITSEGFALSAGAIGQLNANNIQIGEGTTFEDGYAPEDIQADTETSLKEDLRMTAPLPTSLTLNQDGISAYTQTSDKYARLDYRGLFINKGAVQIQRPDGYNVMMDGILQHGFNLFAAYPPFRTQGVEEVGPWAKVATTNRYETIQSYTFKHNSRYLLIGFGLYTDNFINGFMTFDLTDWSGTTSLNIGSTATVSGPASEAVHTYQVDLGVPTGDLMRLNVRLYGSSPDWAVYGRILYIAQEG